MTADGLLELAVGTTEKLRSVPLLPWWNVFRAADAAGLGPSAPVVFECVGVPGMINQVITSAPIWSRVVVVGVCMGADQIRPSIGINKEIDLRFVLGYTPDEFRAALHLLADGKVDPSPLVTGTVGLDGVAAAFEALARSREAREDPGRPAIHGGVRMSEVLVEARDGVQVITINRPEAKNAVNGAVARGVVRGARPSSTRPTTCGSEC